MVIRYEQMQTMQAVAQDNFRDRLAGHLVERHPQTIVRIDGQRLKLRDLDTKRLKQLVAAGIQRARDHGLRAQSALAAFVTTQFVAAPNFDTDKVVRNIIGREDLTDKRRMSVLARATTDEDWKRIRAAYDPLAWSRPGEINA